jgi:hypothetical protein
LVNLKSLNPFLTRRIGLTLVICTNKSHRKNNCTKREIGICAISNGDCLKGALYSPFTRDSCKFS